MDEYISKQAFKDKYLCCGYLPEMSEAEFDTFPAADVVEVRHGYWRYSDGLCYCSECGEIPQCFEPDYCPHCGALMDGKEDGHES